MGNSAIELRFPFFFTIFVFYSMQRIRHIFYFIRHILTARNTKGFGIHSPFLYQFCMSVIYEKHPYYCFRTIEKIRDQLKKNQCEIFIQDFGTGNDRKEKISKIVRKSVKSPKYGQLFFRIIQYFGFNNIIELGTSLGITSLYLASGSHHIKCKTFEGSPELADIARKNFNQYKNSNLEIVTGNISDTFEAELQKTERIDLIFFDANHCGIAVWEYFETALKKAEKSSVFIFDDIYWSADMTKTWRRIKKHPATTATLDLFQLGIVFFNPDLHKRAYRLLF